MMGKASALGDRRAASAKLKPPTNEITLVDTHVHLHACFRLDRAFNAAYWHFTRAARRWPESTWKGVLCLAEGADEDAFERLSENASRSDRVAGPDEWAVGSTEDETALIVRTSSGRELIVITGRQCPTTDGIELLLPGRRSGPGPDCSLAEAMEYALEESGPVLIPWGFGKWFGRRRRLISEIVLNAEPGRILLADSGNRAAGLPEPKLLRAARSFGRAVPAGSDPLPFRSEEDRPGSYGTALDHIVLGRNPTGGVLQALLDPRAYIDTFGSLETTARFVRNQVGMQLRKRSGLSARQPRERRNQA